MYCYKQLSEDLYWIGGNDRRLALFENVYPIPRGVSYNAYIVLDEKTVLLDTVDRAVSDVFFENLSAVLNGRPLDYLVVNHMEPDHAATMNEVVLRYPEVKIICNKKSVAMIKQFFNFDIDSRAVIVGEGDTVSTGRHNFTFVMAPMVHWPEAMVTFDLTDKTLYSADAFGTFGAIGGSIFADEVNFETEWLDDARRYYTNIVGKYGTQVQALLKKAAGLDIAMICPLHGPVWRKNISWFIDKYIKWSTYTPEENAVVIAYASVYGNTENAAQILAMKLGDLGIRNVKMYDVSSTHPSYIVSEAFRASHLVLASTTYNAGIFCNMENLVHDLAAHNIQNRKIAVIENGTWAATSGGLIKDALSSCKNLEYITDKLTIKSAVKASQLEDIENMAKAIADTMPKPEISDNEQKIDPNAMFKLSYGLFLLTSRDNGADNGCIINTVMQVTDTPKRITIAVNKSNYTHDMIIKSGVFNVSVLTTEVPFKLFEEFGFRSGRDTDKFADSVTAGKPGEEYRTENGVRYIKNYTNAVISAKVTEAYDYGTHTLFVADVTESHVISNVPSVTYQYYFDNIKPKPQASAEEKHGWVCKICGYVYEGDELPADYICPLCKHGAEDFERI